MKKESMKGNALKILAIVLLGIIFLGSFFLLISVNGDSKKEEVPVKVNVDSIRQETRDSVEAIRKAIKDSIEKRKEKLLVDSLWRLEDGIKYRNYSLRVILTHDNLQTTINLRLPDNYEMKVDGDKLVVKSYHWIWDNQYFVEPREVTDTIIPNIVIVNSIKKL